MDEHGKTLSISVTTGTILRIFLVVGIVGALIYFRDLVLVLLTAIVIASAIEPATLWLTERRLPRLLAVIIIYLVAIGALVLIFSFVLPTFLHDLASFLNALPQYITSLSVKTKGAGELSGWQSALVGISSSSSVGETIQGLTEALSGASGSILATLTAVFGGALSFLLIVVLSFYLAVSENGIEDFLRLITPLRHERYVIGLWKRSQRKISRWLQGQLILAAIVGVLVFIGLTILGIKNAFVLAIISMMFEIVPLIGPFIGAAPGVLLGVLQGGLAFGVIVALMYTVVQQVESNVIYPLIAKKVLDVPPLIVIVSIIIGAQVGGVLGVLLAVPMAAVVMEYLADVTERRSAARAKFETNE